MPRKTLYLRTGVRVGDPVGAQKVIHNILEQASDPISCPPSKSHPQQSFHKHLLRAYCEPDSEPQTVGDPRSSKSRSPGPRRLRCRNESRLVTVSPVQRTNQGLSGLGGGESDSPAKEVGASGQTSAPSPCSPAPLPCCAPAPWALFPHAEPLHWLFLLPGKSPPAISVWLVPSYQSGFHSHFTSTPTPPHEPIFIITIGLMLCVCLRVSQLLQSSVSKPELSTNRCSVKYLWNAGEGDSDMLASGRV